MKLKLLSIDETKEIVENTEHDVETTILDFQAKLTTRQWVEELEPFHRSNNLGGDELYLSPSEVMSLCHVIEQMREAAK